MKEQLKGWGLTLTLLLSCRTPPDPEASGAAEAAKAEASAVGSSDAGATLDRIDARTPVPLLPMMAHHQKQNMRDHLVAVQEIITGVAANDFSAVAKAAGRIGFSESMGQMCSHMGAGAPGFTETALRFHHGADEIGEAARKQDREGVLTSLGKTLSQCTGCHAQYKQQVVSENEWPPAAGVKSPQHRPLHPSR